MAVALFALVTPAEVPGSAYPRRLSKSLMTFNYLLAAPGISAGVTKEGQKCEREAHQSSFARTPK